MKTKQIKKVEELDQDPIKDIYHSSFKEPIDLLITEKMKKIKDIDIPIKEIPYKDEEKLERWNKRDVLNRMIQLVRYDHELEERISEEFYYLYHSLSTYDQKLFELWINHYDNNKQ